MAASSAARGTEHDLVLDRKRALVTVMRSASETLVSHTILQVFLKEINPAGQRGLILVPAVFVATIFAMTVAIARGDHFWWITLAMAIPGTAVQLGYLAGLVIRAATGWVELVSKPKQPNGMPGKKPLAPTQIASVSAGGIAPK